MDVKQILAALLISACGAANAQSVGELGKVQAETILYQAQAARAEAQAKAQAAGPAGTSMEGTLPVVRGVFGSGTQLFATFLYANGSSVDARRGDRIPGDYVVASVSPTGVVLSRSGRSYPLGFSDLRPFPLPAATPAADPSGIQ